MKKLCSAVMALLLLCTCGCLAVLADGALRAEVFVTIADKGTQTVSYQKITVTDSDGDGALTLSDALYAAHEAAYEGGAEAGYNAYVHKDYGLSLGKLWGDDSGNFGYYLNNASAWSLADPVKDGDAVSAFVYADGESFSDAFCFFDVFTVEAKDGGSVTLTLSMTGYDESWNPVTLPVEGAFLTVDGVKTACKTDKDGKAVLTLEGEGTHVIGAVSDTMTLVPPVCIASVVAKEEEKLPATGDAGVLLFVLLGAAALCGAAVSLGRE